MDPKDTECEGVPKLCSEEFGGDVQKEDNHWKSNNDMIWGSIEEAKESVIPIEFLNVCKYVRHFFKAPLWYRISAVQLCLTVHDIRLPVSDQGEREGIDKNYPCNEENILESLAESVTLSYDLLNYHHSSKW